MISKPPILAAVLTAALLLVPTISAKTSASKVRAQSAQPGTFEAKVEGLLRQSGHEFRKVKTNSWHLIVPGRELAQIRIILGAGPGSIAMGAVVVRKQNLRINADAMLKLMKLSYDLNYVRVCIDTDDDLIVMSQKKDPWLTLDEFKYTISQVTSAADRAYGIMRPYLAAP